MVLKLYASPFSTCSRRVAVVLHEKKVPFELIAIDFLNGEARTPAFLEKQPFGQIPYIDDDGFILYESRAIIWYIATKYADQGTPLIPKDLQGQARLFQAWSVETSHFDHAEKAAVETVFRTTRGLEPNHAAAKVHHDALEKTLEVYDKILSKQKYLAGDELTIVDLSHLPYAYMLPKTGADLISQKPNVKRWYEEISGRTAWQTVKDLVQPIPEA